jgi:hypothetical protein
MFKIMFSMDRRALFERTPASENELTSYPDGLPSAPVHPEIIYEFVTIS